MEWQPISTVPECKSVLIACADGQMHVAWFHEPAGGWHTFFGDEPLNPQWLEERPTHWTYLPEPPDEIKSAIEALEETINSIAEPTND